MKNTCCIEAGVKRMCEANGEQLVVEIDSNATDQTRFQAALSFKFEGMGGELP
jgi:hypothetical protein